MPPWRGPAITRLAGGPKSRVAPRSFTGTLHTVSSRVGRSAQGALTSAPRHPPRGAHFWRPTPCALPTGRSFLAPRAPGAPAPLSTLVSSDADSAAGPQIGSAARSRFNLTRHLRLGRSWAGPSWPAMAAGPLGWARRVRAGPPFARPGFRPGFGGIASRALAERRGALSRRDRAGGAALPRPPAARRPRKAALCTGADCPGKVLLIAKMAR